MVALVALLPACNNSSGPATNTPSATSDPTIDLPTPTATADDPTETTAPTATAGGEPAGCRAGEYVPAADTAAPAAYTGCDTDADCAVAKTSGCCVVHFSAVASRFTQCVADRTADANCRAHCMTGFDKKPTPSVACVKSVCTLEP